jgi:hypothetical protein
LTLLEALVKGLVPEADLSSNDRMQELGKQLGIPLPSVEETTESDQAIATPKPDEDNALPLVPDQQGQVQYIGPASSFSFHLNLRKLIENYSALEFALFGRNAADQPDTARTLNSIKAIGAPERGLETPSGGPSNSGSPSDSVREIEGPILESLIDSYFKIINHDFPILHETTFREVYEHWLTPSSTMSPDPSWLCGLLCVLILARRVAPVAVPEETERRWWRHVQSLLPSVFFASNMFSVQTLLLAALHLHNTSHRDACWNLTGTAVRIAYAIGLHRDDIEHNQTLLGREQRKLLWWTLYAFEHIQVSSYDRPSAITCAASTVGCPDDTVVVISGRYPQDIMKWWHRLVILLGSATKVLTPNSAGTSELHDPTKPLSPVAGILRELSRWEEALPSHLRLGVLGSLPPSSQRSLLLLHAQFFYIKVLITRSSLLRQATMLSKNADVTIHPNLRNLSETCIDSGRFLGRILRQLGFIEKFSALVWWDIFFTVACSLVLVLDVICRVKQRGLGAAVESKALLRDLATLTAKQLEDERVPGTMRKWGTIIVDVCGMAEQYSAHPFSQSNSPDTMSGSRSSAENEQQTVLHGHYLSQRAGAPTSNPFETLSATGFEIAENSPQFWSHLAFLDETNGQHQDLRWDDIEAILRGDFTT